MVMLYTVLYNIVKYYNSLLVYHIIQHSAVKMSKVKRNSIF